MYLKYSFLSIITLCFITSYTKAQCIPATSSCTSHYISKVVFGGINNSSTCSETSGYSDFTSSVAAGTATAGVTLPFTVSLSSITTLYVTVFIDVNRDGSFLSSSYVASGTGTINSHLTIPISTTEGPLRMRVRAQSYHTINSACEPMEYSGETEDYTVDVTAFVCSTPPTPGKISGTSGVCSTNPFSLQLNGTYYGYQLQWESSVAGTNSFSPIVGATSNSLSTSQTQSTDYRCVVSCAASGQSASSVIKRITTTPTCYCSPNSTCIGTSNITRVQFSNIDNASSGICYGFSDFTSTAPPANVNAGTSVNLTVTLGDAIPGDFAGVGVWIDFNKDGIFAADEFTLVGYGSTFVKPIYISSNALPGITRMRIRSYSNHTITATNACTSFSYGETEEYSININPAPVAIYFNSFNDTLYNNTIHLTGRIMTSNSGLNVSDSLKPRIFAKKQGSFVWKSFKGQLINGTINDGTWDFIINHDTLDVRKNGCDSIQFYFVAQDINVPAHIGYLPEQGALHFDVATQITAPTVLLGYRLKPKLLDTIYVGSGNCRYRSLSAENGLFQDINLKKLQSDLTVIVEGNTIEDGSYALTGSGLNGHRLSIRPSNNTIHTLRVLAGWTGFSSVILDSVKNVVIDGSYNGTGRYLLFRNESASQYETDSISNIKLMNSCDSIFLKNLLFEHTIYSAGPQTAGESAILLSQGNQNIFITNNIFSNISSMNMPVRHISSFGNNRNVLIKQNEFKNFSSNAIKIFENCDNWIIDSNHFYRTEQSGHGMYNFSAISILGTNHIISNNYIGGQAPFCAGGNLILNGSGSRDIYMIQTGGSNTTDSTVISKNTIRNIVHDVAGSNNRPISFSCISTGSGNYIIKDNVIGDPATGSPTIKVVADGIYGICSSTLGHKEIRKNIITGITNGTGSTYIYSDVVMYGISISDPEQSPLYSTPAIISENKLYNIHNTQNAYSPSGSALTIGIRIFGGSGHIVKKNSIYDISCNEQHITGILYEDGDGITKTILQQNRISRIVNNGSSINMGDAYPSITGITLSRGDGNVDVINNQIAINNNNLALPTVLRGIEEENNGSTSNSGTETRIMYNSVYIGGYATNNSSSSPYHYISGSGVVTNRKLYNNIFYNKRTGGTIGHFAYRIHTIYPQTALANTKFNHNFFVLTDTTKFAQYSSDETVNFMNWKTGISVDDSSYLNKSFNVPSSTLFIDKNQGNLNINTSNVLCWMVNEKGLPISGINTDFDGTTGRSTDPVNGKTDIGADEFYTGILEPGIVAFCPGGNYTLNSNITGLLYQWQYNNGSGFINLSNNANYSGVNNASLQLINIPSSWTRYKYRCQVDGNYSNVQEIRFIYYWTGAINNSWGNPGNWSCGSVPDANSDVIINSGTVIINSNVTIYSLQLNGSATITVNTPYTLHILH